MVWGSFRLREFLDERMNFKDDFAGEDEYRGIKLKLKICKIQFSNIFFMKSRKN